MLLGTMDFARLFYAAVAVTSAARAGVQYGALTPGKSGDTDGMNQAALNDASNQGLDGLTAESASFCGCNGGSVVSCSTGACAAGAIPNGYVRTTVNYTFRTLVHYPLVPGETAISRTAILRVQ